MSLFGDPNYSPLEHKDGGKVDPEKQVKKKKKIARLKDYQLQSRLIINKDGDLKPCIANVIKFLREHKEWENKLGYNVRTLQYCFLSEPPFCQTNDGIIEDAELSGMSEWFADNTGMIVSTRSIHESLKYICNTNKFDPVKNYFESLKWDGAERLSYWLIKHANAVNNKYTQAVSRCSLISAVARTYEPGCKVDTMLILESPQGVKKSTLLKKIASKEWFHDSLGDISRPDVVQIINGPLIIEVQELDDFTKKEATAIKSFLSTQIDRRRMPYDRMVNSFPRRCIFVGTTNKDTYLKDDTGGRRFWPVKVSDINVDFDEEYRDQLWAEAIACYKKGEKWYLDDKIEELAKTEQEDRRQLDPWQDIVCEYLHKKSNQINDVSGQYMDRFEDGLRAWTTGTEILLEAISKEAKKWDKRDEMRVGSLMKILGWQKKRERKGVGLVTIYLCPDDWHKGIEEKQVTFEY